MEGNGNKYALAALKYKRASLAGEIVSLEKTLAWKRSQLEKLDATLDLFGESEPHRIKLMSLTSAKRMVVSPLNM
jgi:hypothetical protein